MIVSHARRFIFFAIPKTATHAVRKALDVHLAKDDWQQQMLFGRQSLPIEELAALGHGHISARQLRPHLPEDIFDSYFKFAVVRNPFDRFVSCCAFLNRENSAFARDPVTWMKQALKRPKFRRRVLVRPQSEFLCNEDKQLVTDYLVRYEDLNDGLSEVFARLRLPAPQLEQINTSSRGKFEEYFSDRELLERVGEFYAQDLKLLDYSFS